MNAKIGEIEIDLFSPDTYVPAVPHDQFDWLRANDPVHFQAETDGPGYWALTKYEDVVRVSEDFHAFSSSKGVNHEDAYGGAELMMINMDPPAHTKLRNLVQKGFTANQIRRLEEHIREVCERVIDAAAPKGECDFVADLSSELPLQVIAEMIGIPLEDRQKVFDWSNTMIGMDDPEYGNTIEVAREAAMQMWAYTNELAERRRAGPLREDLLSALLDAEVDGERLSTLDFDMFVLLLAVAGNETTRNSISHGMLALMENPDQREKLAANPELLKPAVEEIIRCATPVMYFRRTATQEARIRDRTIKVGDKVVMYYISANRDEDVFEDPHAFRVDRHPNDHVGFGGGGPHFCLGASLARLEIKVMFEQLLKRLPDMELAGPVARLRSNFINGIKHMPVRFTPRA